MNLSGQNTPDKSNQSLTISLEKFEQLLARIVGYANECKPEHISNYGIEIDGIISLVLDSSCPSEFLKLAHFYKTEIGALWACRYAGGRK